jgi:outer membrane protein
MKKLSLLTIIWIIGMMTNHAKGEQPGALQSDGLTLEEIIAIAVEQNPDVQTKKIEERLMESSYRENQESRYPVFRLNGGHQYNVGRTIDQFTNEFVTRGAHSNQAGIQMQFNLFDGFRSSNTIEKSRLDMQAGKYAIQQEEWSLTMEVVNAYLNVLFSEEMVENRRNQVSLIDKELSVTSRKVEAGEMTRNDELQLKAELAGVEADLVSAENDKRLAYLTLKQLMNMPSDQDLLIEPPELNPVINEPLPEAGEVFRAAREHYPGFRQMQLEIESAEKELAVARSSFYPSVNLHASLGTGFSGARLEPYGDPEVEGFRTIGYTTGGEPVVTPEYSIDTRTVPFTDQLDNNLNRSVGISFSVPIYDGRRAHYKTEQANIRINMVEHRKLQMERMLEMETERIHADAVAASVKYEAALKAYNAHQRAFENSHQRYQAGMLNTLEFMQSGNQLREAESSKLQARYEFYFKRKLVELYMGGL